MHITVLMCMPSTMSTALCMLRTLIILTYVCIVMCDVYSDLNASSLIRMQHKYYLLIGPFMAILFPALVSYIAFNDFTGVHTHIITITIIAIARTTLIVQPHINSHQFTILPATIF